MYEEFLKKVKILETMDSYERQNLPDAFVKLYFKQGDNVIKEGDDGNDMYFLIEGMFLHINKFT